MSKILDSSNHIVPKGQNGIVKKIFDLRGRFAIIGLTGRTGSGCSTVATMLSNTEFDGLPLPLPNQSDIALTNDERKYTICYNYLKENWAQVNKVQIKVTYVILWICMSLGEKIFREQLSKWFDEQITNLEKQQKSKKDAYDIKQHIKAVREKKDTMLKIFSKEIFGYEYKHKIAPSKYKRYKVSQCATKLDELQTKKYRSKEYNQISSAIIDFLTIFFPQFYKMVKKKILEVDSTYNIDAFQVLGNFIREKLEYSTLEKLGVYKKTEKDEKRDNPENYHLSIIVIINLIIKLYRYNSLSLHNTENIRTIKLIIIIDALRNPYEIMFLRERYSAFYAMSVNTTEDERQRRLYMKSYSIDQIKACDKTEYPEKPKLRDIYMKQNIERCNEISDIHLVNEEKDNKQPLAKQIALYLSLILHPGLVTPTNKERTMQIAYTAKYNSGCISRQVGAVITDDNFTIKAIGWNDVPEGQTPCILRNINNVYKQETDRSAYSNYEWTDDTFREKLKDKIEKANWAIDLKGRNVPYCFKDIYNDKKKGQNNQVHTRSLHAEENAFLQIAKYGGQGIKGGKLFTTASPCELCAKKAYQLGIKEIYYIDLYPGISKKHILENGNNCPDMKLFNGAIGRAYIHLYQPLLSYKDELRDLLEPEKH